MNSTSPYWSTESFLTTKKYQPLQERRLGFTFDPPHRDVVTAGWYYGEGALPDRRELVYSAQPEYYAVQDIIPSVGGIPRANPYDRIYHHSRAAVTQKM